MCGVVGALSTFITTRWTSMMRMREISAIRRCQDADSGSDGSRTSMEPAMMYPPQRQCRTRKLPAHDVRTPCDGRRGQPDSAKAMDRIFSSLHADHDKMPRRRPMRLAGSSRPTPTSVSRPVLPPSGVPAHGSANEAVCAWTLATYPISKPSLPRPG
jgi:hypothetical protein